LAKLDEIEKIRNPRDVVCQDLAGSESADWEIRDRFLRSGFGLAPDASLSSSFFKIQATSQESEK
jgi:hypothetical protein